MPTSREGLLWTPTGETLGLATDSVVSGTPPSAIRETYDVVVVGAGFAGLIAARDLSEKQLQVLLLDGRDRIGGRTWTAQALGEEFEMGGTWVHWNQPHLYSELHRYDLQSHLKTSSGTLDPKNTFYTAAFGDSQEVDGIKLNESVERVATAFFAIDGLTSHELMPYPHEPFREPAPWTKYDQLTVADRLGQLDIPQAEKDVFDTMVSSLGSAPGNVCGFTEILRWYTLGGHSMAGMFELAGIHKLGKGGMTHFAKSILSDFHGHLLFDTVINKIVQSRQFVTLQATNGRQVRARQVILTIPHNVLPDVEFSPPLPKPKDEAIKGGHINQGAKIHFHLSKSEPGWFSLASGYGDSPWCFAFSDHNGTKTKKGTYCIGFGYGSHLTDPHASDHIISSFKRCIKGDADVDAYLTHDWMNDPLAKGVWSCWGPNSMTRWLRDLQSSHGRIHFASADWADGWRGFVDGAIEQGARAARQVQKQAALAPPEVRI